LRFKLAQNDTAAVPFREVAISINEKSIAGYVALTGEIVNIEDAYHLPPDVPYSINRKFDEDSGYRTKSILAVPIRNQKEKIIAVLQLINAKRDFSARLDSHEAVEQQVLAFSPRQQEIVQSLAGQAAVALENSQLYDSIQRLFEGFVRAAVTAIETRDPATLSAWPTSRLPWRKPWTARTLVPTEACASPATRCASSAMPACCMISAR
jgi:GAF domain-containing protein